MKKKRIAIALGHDALGTTLPEQKEATRCAAKAIADLIQDDCQVVITHSNGPQVGMIHTAMSEFHRLYTDYTATPMSVCSAMSQGYIGYDLQNAIRTELMNRGVYRTVSTLLTQVVVDPYDEAFYRPSKIIGRVMTEEEAEEEEKKGNHVVKTEDGYRRIVAAPNPMQIVEIDAVNALMDADQVVIAAGDEVNGEGAQQHLGGPWILKGSWLDYWWLGEDDSGDRQHYYVAEVYKNYVYTAGNIT